MVVTKKIAKAQRDKEELRVVPIGFRIDYKKYFAQLTPVLYGNDESSIFISGPLSDSFEIYPEEVDTLLTILTAIKEQLKKEKK